jgi:hypothetical protein
MIIENKQVTNNTFSQRKISLFAVLEIILKASRKTVGKFSLVRRLDVRYLR